MGGLGSVGGVGSVGEGDWKKVRESWFCAGAAKLQASARSNVEALSSI